MIKEFNQEEKDKLSYFLKERMGITDSLPGILRNKESTLEIDLETKTYTLNNTIDFEIYPDGIIYF